jgi:hypothetical protein
MMGGEVNGLMGGSKNCFVIACSNQKNYASTKV